MSRMTIFGLILYSIMPFGQLWTRIFDYGGTIDMVWFLFPLFMIFPFQFIPVLLLYLGYIKPGKGGKVYDIYVWIPIFTKMLILMFRKMVLPGKLSYILGEIIMILTIMGTKYLHSSESCNYNKKELNITSSKLADFFMDAIFENGMAGILSFLIMFIPGIGWIISLLSLIDFINKIKVFILYAIGYSSIYIIQNMFEQLDMSSLCNSTSIPKMSYAKFVFGILLLLVTYLTDPGDGISLSLGKKKKSKRKKYKQPKYEEVQYEEYTDNTDNYTDNTDNYTDDTDN